MTEEEAATAVVAHLEEAWGGFLGLFRRASNDNEIIFARYYTVGARHVPTEIANGPNGYDGWGGNVPLQNLVDAYRMANGRANPHVKSIEL